MEEFPGFTQVLFLSSSRTEASPCGSDQRPDTSHLGGGLIKPYYGDGFTSM